MLVPWIVALVGLVPHDAPSRAVTPQSPLANYPSPLHPLDAVMAKDIGVAAMARALVGRDGTVLDGKGLRLGDFDADTFVFHPALFRADGGAFAWIDTDGDGAFQPGVDAVDRNANGVADAAELASVLSVKTVDLSFKEFDPHVGFDATLDYVFLDDNGDGKRNFGAGFTEETPAFGEPLFVADDVDGDGKLGRNERLLELKTSKYAAIFSGGKEYTRGNPTTGILAYGTARFGGDKPTAYVPEHGTLVGSVMVGGAGSHRYFGVAPAADLYLATSQTAPVTGLKWLAKQKLDAVGVPYGSVVGGPADGTSPTELAVEDIFKSGAFVSVSVGNDGANGCHASLEAPAKGTIKFHIDLKSTTGLYLTLRVAEADTDLSATLVTPNKEEIPLVDAYVLPSGAKGNAETNVSPRGTTSLDAFTVGNMPAGTYELRVTSGAAAPRTIHAFTLTTATIAATFQESSPAYTLGYPATADDSFAAAGYVIHPGAEYGTPGAVSGELATFSAHGPRIDGAHVLGVAAPVNPIGATFIGTKMDTVAYRAWPGTSNAAPEVAAAAGLLRQIFPNESARDIGQRIATHARRDAFVTNDVDTWGAGKLDLAAAAGLSPSSGAAPHVSLELPPTAGPKGSFVAHLVVDDAVKAKLEARWDFDYDGTWDTDWIAAGDATVPTKEAFPLAVKVEVHDEQGNLVGAAGMVARGEGPSRSSEGCSAAPGGERRPVVASWLPVVAALLLLARKRASRRDHRQSVRAMPSRS